MGYQSKTWSLSDEVVAEIERRVQEMTAATGSGSPNRVLRQLLLPPREPGNWYNTLPSDQPAPPARELLVELDGEGE